MKENKFDALARQYFGDILIPRGFSCDKSKFSNFYRQVSDDIVHFVFPDFRSGGNWYDIKVFASSPKIEPLYLDKFPDDLGIPSDSLSYLNPISGVKGDQKRFHCRTEEGFVRGFVSEVAPALCDKALPYLDRIVSLRSLIPTIRHDFYLGMALWRVGEKDAARELLNRELAKLMNINDETGGVAREIKYVKEMLAEG